MKSALPVMLAMSMRLALFLRFRLPQGLQQTPGDSPRILPDYFLDGLSGGSSARCVPFYVL